MMGSGAELDLPPGFRFHPTDEELVNHYLCRKCAGLPIVVPIIAEIDLYKYDPWQLPELARYGEKEWYFFSPRDRKYPNGSRPNRAAGTGYWKATGADKPIGKPKALGIKKALVFYAGKAPKGIKTNWIMHEYRPANVDRSPGSKNNLRLDDWVLCRLYNKKGRMEKYYPTGTDQSSMKFPEMEDRKPDIKKLSHQKMTLPPQPSMGMGNDPLHMDTSESVPWLNTDSSSSEEQVLSPPGITCDKEAQSEPKWNELENAPNEYDFQFNYDCNYNYNYIDDDNNSSKNSSCFQDDPFGAQLQYQMDQFSPLQDLSMILQKPF